ncbi:MAG: hypothetical protein COV57_02650 [Candidatus Liptonbacteria bacterium CG11_big_fil_rev_8_21_14_0_20_35_14]|uniref:Uncharacterized protein n=1 Tax=Candidatus Liptonbacteria bacterium CG11_big_fil_rev_8_21_14_0_20_35_14 TaxID=1974634 RepID=A0A2H0N7A2_9BACT|nr:MAG: hypothetical protein COV57_02650 [Candidatus Liptonbacteria bacterium CG11_big_fil_rev_8_21_14_0_20_35_14]
MHYSSLSRAIFTIASAYFAITIALTLFRCLLSSYQLESLKVHKMLENPNFEPLPLRSELNERLLRIAKELGIDCKITALESTWDGLGSWGINGLFGKKIIIFNQMYLEIYKDNNTSIDRILKASLIKYMNLNEYYLYNCYELYKETVFGFFPKIVAILAGIIAIDNIDSDKGIFQILFQMLVSFLLITVLYKFLNLFTILLSKITDFFAFYKQMRNNFEDYSSLGKEFLDTCLLMVEDVYSGGMLIPEEQVYPMDCAAGLWSGTNVIYR